MIKQLELKRFKSVVDETKLEMAPLTIFSGANNSGKSTVIQSILLTTQTLQNMVPFRTVILNGHILKLGTFADIVSKDYLSDKISIGFELIPQAEDLEDYIPSASYTYFEELGSVKFNFSFSCPSEVEKKELVQLYPYLESIYIKANGIDEENKAVESETEIFREEKALEESIKRFQLSDKITQSSERRSFQYKIKDISSIKRGPYPRRYNNLAKIGEVIGFSFLHFLPEYTYFAYDQDELGMREFLSRFIESGRLPFRPSRGLDTSISVSDSFKNKILDIVDQFTKEVDTPIEPEFFKDKEELSKIFSLEKLIKLHQSLKKPRHRAIFSELIDKNYPALTQAAKIDRPQNYKISRAPLPSALGEVTGYINYFFSKKIHYLGPLRDEPKPIYPLAGVTDPKDIGFKGEHTASVLDRYKNEEVEYIPSSQILLSQDSPVKIRAKLIDAILDWLNYMGVGARVDTIDQGKLGHEFKVAATSADSMHDLTHVGVGVSQILPILVLSLLAECGSTLIFEQPEIHLHPRVQTRLADFFISITLLRKQCIVETHSEYLINRLRYLAVISKEGYAINNTLIYFAEKQEEHSRYRPIRINEFGVIEDWPKGFFDENEENSAQILKAAVKKKKQKDNA